MRSVPGDGRQNNFDVLRLLAAFAVLFSHSFALKGLSEPAIGSLTLGDMAVLVFFGISGFLICQSWLTEPHLPTYLAKRALRIYPALIVVLVLTVAVLGPLVTTSRDAYLHSSQPASYAATNLLLWTTSYHLPGVFHSNPYPNVVNGSLWTLATEIRAYLMIAVLGMIGLLGRRLMATIGLVVIGAIALWGSAHARELTGDDMLLHAFCVGTVLFLWRDKVPWRADIAFGALAAAIVLAGTTFGEHAAALAIPYFAIFAAYRTPLGIGRLTSRGDFSYGLYLYAFPVTQLVVLAWPGVPVGVLIVVSGAVTYGLAVLSWKLVESPALALKRRVVSHRTRRPGIEDAALTAAEH